MFEAGPVPGLLLSTDSDFDRWDVEDSPVDSVGGFGTVLADLARLGFHVEWMCLRASDVGASHGRKRVFILAYRDGARLDRYAWKHDGGQSPLSARSGECCGLLEHSTSIRTGEPADEVHSISIGGETRAESGGGFGNMDDSDLSRRTRALRETCSGRDAFNSASAYVGIEPGYALRRDDSGLRECAATEQTGDELEHADSGGREGPGIHLRSARSDEAASISDRRDGNLEHSQRERCREAGRGWSEISGAKAIGGDVDVRHEVAQSGEQLGNAEGGGRGECGESSERVRLFNGSNEDLGIFAYGPSDPRWQDVLVRYPWLRPSYSQAEAESDLRDLVDGLADVPLQAAVAFRVLLRRILAAKPLLAER
jgi:site-specific DNA-cytosine methylase